jgi:hypothetical protein
MSETAGDVHKLTRIQFTRAKRKHLQALVSSSCADMQTHLFIVHLGATVPGNLLPARLSNKQSPARKITNAARALVI